MSDSTMGDLINELTIRWARSLRQARAAAGLSQAELGELAGITQQLISQYEGALIRPTDERRILLARALGTTVADLFPYSDNDPDEPNGNEEAA